MSEGGMWLVCVICPEKYDYTSLHQSFDEANDEFNKQKNYHKEFVDIHCPVLIFIAPVFESFEIGDSNE